MKATIRSYQAHDLGPVLALCESTARHRTAPGGLTLDQTVGVVSSASAVSLVAEVDGSIAGLAVGTVAGGRGSISVLTVSTDGDTSGEIVHQLLEHLEARLGERGAQTLGTLSPEGDEIREQLEQRGYLPSQSFVYLERELPETAPPPTAIAEVGGRMIERGLWDKLQGMEEIKQIIERRVILPLVEPELASRHWVSAPKAILLFGPPGTGKTTFVKAIASHLEWPLIEVQPGELAGEGAERQAKLLAQRFDAILELDSAVVFVDEVEDLASMRHEQRKVRPSVTNEFLKQIPRMRGKPRHLLVCATNLVGQLDPAFLRHGRFDYILPIGPPDDPARTAMWQSLAADITDEDVDIDVLVKATELFTPADVEFAARKAAHMAFEREHFEGGGHRASTDDFLTAIAATKRTLSEDMVDNFRKETREFARY
jgi:transitional endoplasmic reticulum ATPase